MMLGDGVNPRPRHDDIREKKCPFCRHRWAFLKMNFRGRYMCSRCKRYHE